MSCIVVWYGSGSVARLLEVGSMWEVLGIIGNVFVISTLPGGGWSIHWVLSWEVIASELSMAIWTCVAGVCTIYILLVVVIRD